MTYKKRSLKFQFKLSSGSFDDKNKMDMLTIENAKAEVQVAALGSLSANTMDAKVYGLSLKNMAAIGYKGTQYGITTQNMMKVWADDTPIFEGSIGWSFVDANEMPDAPLIINASSTGYAQSVEAAPFNKAGVVKVADVISSIAVLAGYSVRISPEVNEVENNPFYKGNYIDQIRDCCRAHDLLFDIRLGVIFVWKEGDAIDESIPFVSPRTGLLGYPRFNGWGIEFNTTFSPLLILGRDVQLETDLPNASGKYRINSAVHHLSTWMEGGPWMTQCSASLFTAGR